MRKKRRKVSLRIIFLCICVGIYGFFGYFLFHAFHKESQAALKGSNADNQLLYHEVQIDNIAISSRESKSGAKQSNPAESIADDIKAKLKSAWKQPGYADEHNQELQRHAFARKEDALPKPENWENNLNPHDTYEFRKEERTSIQASVTTLANSKRNLLYNGSIANDPNIQSDVLAFVHIPKCSGDSFKSQICQIAGKAFKQFPPCGGTNSWNAPGCGNPIWNPTHCGYDEIADCMNTGRAKGIPHPKGRKTLFVTVLRDPVERVISEFFWWKNGAPGGDCKRLHQWGECLCLAARKGIEAWVKSPCNFAHNRQTRYFTMKDEIAPGNKKINLLNMKEEPQWECSTFYTIYGHDYWSKQYKKTFGQGLLAAMNEDSALSDYAIQVLESRFWFVGIQEDYKTSMALFSKLTQSVKGKVSGSKREVKNSKKGSNASSKKPVSEELKHLIRDLNKLDDKLYKYMATRLKQASAVL